MPLGQKETIEKALEEYQAEFIVKNNSIFHNTGIYTQFDLLSRNNAAQLIRRNKNFKKGVLVAGLPFVRNQT